MIVHEYEAWFRAQPVPLEAVTLAYWERLREQVLGPTTAPASVFQVPSASAVGSTCLGRVAVEGPSPLRLAPAQSYELCPRHEPGS